LEEKQIHELERLCGEMEALHEQNKVAIAEVLELNDRFHQIILEASENRRLTEALRAAMEIPRVYKSYYWRDKRETQRSFLYHRELIEAFRNQDPLWAEATMKSHVHAARDYLLARLREEREGRSRSA
jgi:DNA-binding GntR family transcriptional regulator